ncbi:T9SS type A sorting domain-containing protein [Fluviicola chungangensis]|uniref:T9SS type A sorting domain-containing protein n=1 Tax=Fluviicola chungangensis TaxID=2597671 RepID=A0A556MYN1_9FLAO|nr:T9SS type A sorting domain-containing protein [Fluviicola chungangensis]TSJ45031.1 T9SS type A sorting domain-containing protein [Fluviicola chungangensis]
MKKMNYLVMTLLCMGCSLSAYNQEFKKVSLPKGIYSETKSFERINQKRVNDAWKGMREIYSFDFTDASTKSVSGEIEATVDLTLKKSGFVSYSNTASISNLLGIRPEVLSVQLPYEDRVLTLDLVQVNIFTDEFKLETSTPGLEKGVDFGLYYQGTVRGEDAVVGVSFFRDEFFVLINRNSTEDATIEAGLIRLPENRNSIHVIYSDDDLKNMPVYSCGSEGLEQYREAVERLSSQKQDLEQMEKATYKCVTYFWETRYNLYTAKGSTQAVTNHITNIFNNFKLMYENEQIGSKLNQLYVWTTADTYNDDLNTFSANRSNFGANIATLFSNTGGGGVAWLDQLCGSNEYYKHGFCGAVGGTVNAVPTYSWAVNVTTHEVGHNLGSPHTHACSWTGGAIDGCGPQAGYSEGCNGPIPANGGTIMSYCHLTSVGINFTLGFGPQPGNLIRSRVNSCITLTCNTDGGGQTCTTAYEPNETQSAATTLTSGTAVSAAIATSGDIDFFKITTSTTTNNVFSLAGPSGVDFDLVIYNSGGTQIGSSTSGTATESVTLNGQAAGTYYAKVFGYNNAVSSTCYTFTATATAVTNCSTAYEPNNSTSAAVAIPLSATISAAISSSTDQDYYKVTTTSVGTHQFALAGPTGVDYDLYIYNSGGTLIGSGTGTTATENVSISNLAVGTYTVRVFGYNGANSTACYTLNVAKTSAAFSGEESNPSDYSVYPNPAKDKLTVSSSNPDEVMHAEVLDMSGKVLSSTELRSNAAIDVSGISSGVYFVKIVSDNKEVTQIKFVKE